MLAAAPFDPRPVCNSAATALLARMLRGEHDVLLPEWFALCQLGGMQVPGHIVPTLLLRGRRQPGLDLVVRSLVGAKAAWLADAMPELGIRAAIGPIPADAIPFLPPAPPPDSSAVVTAITESFLQQLATWAAAPQLRLAVASIDPAWLPALVQQLNRAPFSPVTERARVDLLGLAQARRDMVTALQPAPAVPAVNASPNPAAGTRVRLQP
jgi:hypothetical protein